MRGLMSDPSGRILEIPVKASLKEGLTVLEYFISTTAREGSGRQHGVAYRRLRLSDAPFRRRRSRRHHPRRRLRHDQRDYRQDIRAGKEVIEPLTDRIIGRRCAEEVRLEPKRPTTAIVTRGDEIDGEGRALIDAGVDQVKIRSVLTCQSKYGVCSMCYGRDLATGNKADIGTAVGIIAAQSIGEPGTQLHPAHLSHRRRCDRRHHHRSSAGRGILRSPQAERSSNHHRSCRHGKVRRRSQQGILLVVDEAGEEHEYDVPHGTHLVVHEGYQLQPGEQLNEGSLNPHDILRIKGETALQNYLVQEVQQGTARKASTSTTSTSRDRARDVAR